MTHLYSISKEGESEFKDTMSYLQTGTIKTLVEHNTLIRSLSYIDVKRSLANILNLDWDTVVLPQDNTWFIQGFKYSLGAIEYTLVMSLSPEGIKEIYAIVHHRVLHVSKYIYGTSDLIALLTGDVLDLKHEFTGYIKYEIRGLLLGYPPCCINGFIDHVKSLESIVDKEPRKLDGSGYLPCIECNSKYTEEELIQNINAVRHSHFKPFPNSN